MHNTRGRSKKRAEEKEKEEGGQAVSYTHLDVYKRQYLYCVGNKI